MGVRAKFRCDLKQRFPTVPGQSDPYETLTFSAVMSGSEENKAWSTATPFGMLTMSITNPAAFDQFEQGKEYFLDFTPVTSIGDRVEAERAGTAG